MQQNGKQAENYSSTIVEDLISCQVSDARISVAYWYFDFNDREKQSTESMIRSLLKQILCQSREVPESLQQLYGRNLNGNQQPSLCELTQVLADVVETTWKIYLIFDALDECRDREDLFEVFGVIQQRDLKQVRMLATSRGERDIQDALRPLISDEICIQSAEVDSDIMTFINDQLRKDSKLRKWGEVIKEEIKTALMKGAHGM